jgi:hypothetical protein
MVDHGYVPYTHGCRCQVCKDAKAAYQRDLRADATRNAQPGVMAAGGKHGTRAAYKDRGCRCDQCTAAMRRIWRTWSQVRRGAGDE